MSETVIDNTSAVATETPADTSNVDAGAASAASAASESEASITIDDLLKMGESDYPELKDDANYKGMKPLAEWMKHVPEDVRKHIANIRSDYTRKTQALAQQRAELEEQKAILTRKDEYILNGTLAQSLKNINVEENYDLFDPEGVKAEIKRQAALMLKDMLEPAQKELALQQRKVELDNFKSKHPEMVEPAYKENIVKLLQERPELKLEDAFYITKAKLGSEAIEAEKAKMRTIKDARKEVALKSSGGSRAPVAGTPQFKTAVEAYNYWKSQGMK